MRHASASRVGHLISWLCLFPEELGVSIFLQFECFMGQSLPVILSHSKSVFQEESEGLLRDISAKIMAEMKIFSDIIVCCIYLFNSRNGLLFVISN